MALGGLLGGGGDGNTIRVRILADGSQVPQGVGQAVGGLESGLGKLVGISKLGYAAAGAAAVTFAKASVDSAMEAEKAQRGLEGAYKRFPAIADVPLQAYEKLAAATMKQTAFDDEAAKSAISRLAMFDLTGQQIRDLLPLTADLAQKTGRDLPDAAEALGKAMLGNTRPLKELGITYKATGDRATDFANISAAIQAKAGGAAASYAKSTEGQLKQLGNAYGELKESVGAAFLPLIQTLVPMLVQVMGILAPVLKWVAENIQYVAIAMVILGGPVTATIGVLILLIKYWDQVVVVLAAVWGALQTAGAWIADVAVKLWDLLSPFSPLVAGITAMVAIIRGDWMGAFNAVLGPIRAVIGAISDLIGWVAKIPSKIPLLGRLFMEPGGDGGGGGLGPTPYGLGGPGGGFAGGGGTIRLDVNVHGNVGDPATVGARAVGALKAYVKTAGTRELRALFEG